MWRTTVKGLLGHKLRLALTILAIMLGTGLVAGSYVFTDTLDRVFSDLFSESFAGIDAQVSGATPDELSSFSFPARLDESLVGEIGSLDTVDIAVGSVAGLITLIDSNGEALGGFGPPTIGTSWSDVASPVTIRDGAAPRGDRELAIDAATARRFELEVGDDVSVLALGAPQRFRMVGTIGLGGSSNFGGATFVTFTYETAQRLFEAAGEVDTISVVAAEGVSPDELVVSIEAIVGDDVSVVDAETAAEEQLSGFKEALGFVNTFLVTFGYVSLFVGGFLIFNTFQVIVAQRTKELALLRAIGATKRQVRTMVLVESLVVSVIGSVLGVVFGVVLAIGIREAFSRFGGEIPATTPQILPRTIAIAVGSGVLVTLVAALVPAIRASRVPPIAAMRQVSAPPSTRLYRIAMGSGSAISALGGASIALGLFIDPPGNLSRVVFVGRAVFLFIGLAVLSAAFARPLGRTLGAPIRCCLRRGRKAGDRKRRPQPGANGGHVGCLDDRCGIDGVRHDFGLQSRGLDRSTDRRHVQDGPRRAATRVRRGWPVPGDRRPDRGAARDRPRHPLTPGTRPDRGRGGVRECDTTRHDRTVDRHRGRRGVACRGGCRRRRTLGRLR